MKLAKLKNHFIEFACYWKS